jgi:hypothetical protein
MSVPLDRLYNFIDGLCNRDVLIYRFFPHGSKKLEHLLPLHELPSNMSDRWYQHLTTPVIIFHDQEPLDYNLYNLTDFQSIWDTRIGAKLTKEIWQAMHLRSVIRYPLNAYDKVMLCHSEKNSEQLSKYESSGFVGVYWWSHGIIAQDWFRFAQHDVELTPSNITRDFLIYNRAWTGTREYRLKFSEQLIDHGLVPHCKVSFSKVDGEINYLDYQYKNSRFKINRLDIDQHMPLTSAGSTASADYDNADYQTTAIEVVLETLFDDSRLHLTEKSLRPIACGKPFILVSTPGSLEYLRSYGIKTFDGLINESYDTINDPVDRMAAVIAEMKRIALLPLDQKQTLWTELYKIAKYNQERFFSPGWHSDIVKELVNNLNHAMENMSLHRTGRYWKQVNAAQGTPLMPGYRTEDDNIRLLKWLSADLPFRKIEY